MDNNNLQHIGIKGMRWGIRRFQNKDGSLTPEGRKRYADDDGDSSGNKGAHEDHIRAHTRRDVSTMSDKELNDYIVRRNREKQYAELNKTKKSWVREQVEKIAKEIAADYASKAAKGAFKMALTKAADRNPKTREMFENFNWVDKKSKEGN